MNGIYFSANDAALEWLIAAVNSVRAHGSTLPIWIIPYTEPLPRVRAFAKSRNLTVWEDTPVHELDGIGDALMGRDNVQARAYRRLVTFDGPFEHFLYADNDVVALMNWDEILEAYARSGSKFWYFGLSKDRVYQPGPALEALRAKQKGVCFNTGSFVSSRGVLTPDSIRGYADEMGKRHQELFYAPVDQSFMNYCIDHSEVEARSVADGMPGVYDWNWAQSEYGDGSDVFAIADRTGYFRGKRFPMVHWAGSALSPYMPYPDLFLKYRLMGASVQERLDFGWKWQVRPRLSRIKRRIQPG